MILLQNRSYGIDDNILKSKNYKNRFNKKLYPEGLKRKCVDFNLHTRTSPESACSCSLGYFTPTGSVWEITYHTNLRIVPVFS